MRYRTLQITQVGSAEIECVCPIPWPDDPAHREARLHDAAMSINDWFNVSQDSPERKER